MSADSMIKLLVLGTIFSPFIIMAALVGCRAAGERVLRVYRHGGRQPGFPPLGVPHRP